MKIIKNLSEPVPNLFLPHISSYFCSFLPKICQNILGYYENFRQKSLKICQNLKLKKIGDGFLAILIVLSFYNQNLFAKDNSQYPNISGDALFSSRLDRVNSSNNPNIKSISGLINVKTEFALNINKNWSVITDWKFEQVKNISQNSSENPERYRSILYNRGLNLNDDGLLIEQLKGKFENEDARFFFGKFNPEFGSAFRESKRIGIFTADFNKDYQLRKKIGAGFAALLENGEIEFSLFANDTTPLQESVINKQDNSYRPKDSAGSKSSYSVAAKGRNLLGVRDLNYNVGYRNLAVKNTEDRDDETGFVGGLEYILPTNSKVLFIPFVEIASIKNFSGNKDRDALYKTIALAIKYSGWTSSVSNVVRDIKQKNIPNPKDSQMQYSVGYEFNNNIALDVTKAKIKEGGEDADLIGVNASYSINF